MEDIEAAEATASHVRSFLGELYPDHAERLYELCLHGRRLPLGAMHPEILRGLVAGSVDDDVFDCVAIAYVLLTGYYFLLDAGVDDHLDNRSDLVYLTLLESGATLSFVEAISRIPIDRRTSAARQSIKRLSENVSGWLLEFVAPSTSKSVQERIDRMSIVGRANSFLLLYDVLCMCAGKDPDPSVTTILEDFAVIVQESDDLADWQSDYRQGRSTPFLRRALARAVGASESSGDIPIEEQVERYLYLTGAYERMIVSLIRQLDMLITRIESMSNVMSRDALHRLFVGYRESLVEGLRNLIEIKSDAGIVAPEGQ